MDKRKYKILYINDSFLNNSGCSVIAKNTYELFKKKGYITAVFTSKNWFSHDEKSYEYSKYFSERFDTISKYLVNLFKYYYNWTAAKNLSKLIEEFNPDIVHCHSLRNSSLTYSILSPIKKRKIPVLMTLHDVYLICPSLTLMIGNKRFCKNYSCKNFNKFHCFFNKCASNYEQSLRISLMSFINKLTGFDKYITKFITPSNALKELMLKHNNDIYKNNIVTINNFLSNEELKTIPNYSNKGYFLYIGRLSKEKGLNYLLEALKDLPKEIKLKIVGTGEEEKNLKQYAKENNLNNVEFIGFKNREEIKEYYQSCIATILPCNWFEIFGMTNIESFINGKPVIASNIGGIPEIVEHNVNGLLFEPANVEQLKEHILTYWNNSELVVKHGKNGYQKAITKYSEENYYKQLLSVYEELIDTK